MEHNFELPVLYNGEELIFPGKLIAFGYSYRFSITIEDQDITFEKDDEMNYRAVNYHPDKHVTIDIELLEAIVDSLSKIDQS